VGTSNIGGVQGCTISLQAAVHPGRTPRALIEKKKEKVIKILYVPSI
jgi:hypothetical protein